MIITSFQIWTIFTSIYMMFYEQFHKNYKLQTYQIGIEKVAAKERKVG